MTRFIATLLILTAGLLPLTDAAGQTPTVQTGSRTAEPAPLDTAITTVDVEHAERIIGLGFDEPERELMLPDLIEMLRDFHALRMVELPNSLPPALAFQPLPAGTELDTSTWPSRWSDPGDVQRPKNLEEAAFYSVGQLGVLIRTRQVTSVELTQMCLSRLKKYGPELECVISLTEQLAMKQAARADAETEAGYNRGPLHGIPYGLKDLFAVKGTKTTWGAEPYKDQVINETATVVAKLESAGAVLVAKLTSGALAWGDVWYGGTTKNPWNLEQGSSGSSAGPASAVAAGLVPFAIGTETWGSIVSPCTRCGVTGLRPTFGRVSRAGAMALSWSMDKVGPIARAVEDCAMVFEAIQGSDGKDQTAVDRPFGYQPNIDLGELRIGYLESAFQEDYPGKEMDQAALDVLRGLGAQLVPIALPDYPIGPLAFVLSAEAAAAFDELTRSGRDDLLVRQERRAWPNVFRASRFIPAVEYIQANRARTLLGQKMQQLLARVDVYVTPTFGGDNLLLTNLTGHPCVVVPNGFVEENAPKSITFIGDLYDEATVLALARAYQEATEFHLQHPPGF
jgi:Asp-tRNA(Asn)/Glu-tRNA(Gln) amidotransferase A subunit family amidase